jgi:hypothetical protein
MMWTFLVLLSPSFAQDLTLPAASPRAEVMQRVGVLELRVNYASPGKKDRTIWGELVPYDTLWRTGANAATTFETDGDLTVGGVAVPAGKYSLFTIPAKDAEWTVVLNKDATANTGNYDEKKDQARFKVKPEEAPARERLTFLFSDTTDTGTRLDLEWAGLRLSVPVTVDTAGIVKQHIATYTTDASDTLAGAARYRAENGDLPGAVTLIDASIAVEPSWYNTWLKADFLHQQADHKNAYKLAQKAQEMGSKVGDDFFWKDRVEKALAEWKKK